MNNEDIRTSDSIDAKVTQDLIETLVDGQNGFSQAAEHITDENTHVAGKLHSYSTNRKAMADDLRAMAVRYGDTVDSDGSVVAGLHRGWIGLKDALTGKDVDAVVNAAITGEKHAVSEFEKALDEEISAELRMKVQDQLASIRSTKQELEALVAG